MRELKLLAHLIRGDRQRSKGDFGFFWVRLGPWVNALFFALLLPRLVWLLKDDLDLVPYLPFVLGYWFLWLTPLGLGLGSALMLFEEEEVGFLALATLPVSQRGLLAYRLWLPGLLAFFTILGTLWIVSPNWVALHRLAWLALGGALLTPLLAFLLFSFARHKTQAASLATFFRFLGLFALFGFLLPQEQQNLAGLVFPPYWFFKAYQIALTDGPGFWSHLALGFLFLLPLLGWARGLFLERYGKALLA